MYGGDRRSSQDGGRGTGSGFFGVASPPNSNSNRTRPMSAGTQLRQKPPAPSHQDLFATLGIDASAGARSSFFSSRGSTASRSSMTGPPPPTGGNMPPSVPHSRYGAPPQDNYSAPPPPSPATQTNWSGSTSRFAHSTTTSSSTATSSSSFRPPPVSSAFAAAPPVAAPPAKPTTNLFSIEDTDAFEMGDGWQCDSPSAVLSPAGAVSNPKDEGDVGLDDLGDDDFGWDEEVDKQFGITPPKPASALSPVVAPPLAVQVSAPPPTASTSFAYTASGAFSSSQAARQPTTSSVAASAPAAASVPGVAEFGSHAERDSWSESWGESSSFSDQKEATTAVSHTAPLSAPAIESIPVANEFWGDQDDDALFDEDEHANDKWDESPVVQDATASVSRLSLQEQEAAAIAETADIHQQPQYHQPPTSLAPPPPQASQPSPSSFGYSSGAYPFQSSRTSFETPQADEHASSESHGFRNGASTPSRSSITGTPTPSRPGSAGATTPSRPSSTGVSFAAEKTELHFSTTSTDRVSFSTSATFSEQNEFSHGTSGSALYAQKPSPTESPSASYFATPSPSKDEFAASTTDSIAFSQPRSECQQSSGFENNDYQQQEQAQNDHQVPSQPEKGWEMPESYGQPNEDWGNDDGEMPSQPIQQEVESDQKAISSTYASSETGTFHYNDRSAHHDEARFYASVREHQGSSTASIGGDVSSAGATFGGSDYVSDGFSDGNFSETRSMVGSSNASTAFGTDFPSVSEGFSAAATTFGGSDYVSDGQFSDGNVSETPSLNESSSRSAENGSDLPPTGEDQQYFGEMSGHNEAVSPFDRPQSSDGAFHGGFSSAPPTTMPFNHEGESSGEVNPFASSTSSFHSSPFASAEAENQATSHAENSEYVVPASSLFGETAGADVPNPFGSEPSSSSFAEKELPAADAGDLFGSTPASPGFGNSFVQPPQQYDQQSYQSYDQGYQQNHGYYQASNQAQFSQQAEYEAATAFSQGSTTSAAELFGQNQGSHDGFSSSAASFGQNDASANAFGYPSQAADENTFASYDQYGGQAPHADTNHATGQAHDHQEQSVSENYLHGQSGSVPPSPAFSASSVSTKAQDGAQNLNYAAYQGGGYSSENSAFSKSHNQYESTTSFAAVTAEATQESSHAQGFFGYSQQHNEQYGQSEKEASDVPEENAQPSAHGFFGEGASSHNSFGSTNEFFSGASSSTDGFGYGQQAPPNEEAAYKAPEEQNSYQQQQPWAQSDAFSNASGSVHGDELSVPPPPPHQPFAASDNHNSNSQLPSSGYTLAESARPDQPGESAGSYFGHTEKSHSSSTSQPPSELPAPAGQSTPTDQGIQGHHQSDFSASYQTNQSSSVSAPNEPTASFVSTPAANASPQYAESSQYFGAAPPQREEFGVGYTNDQFSGFGSESTMFNGPPPQEQKPTEQPSYFGEQPSQSTAYSGFDQQPPTGFAPSNRSPSDFFSSALQQKPEASFDNGRLSGENTSAYQAPGGHALYQQSLQQQAHSYNDHHGANVAQLQPAQTHAGNFGGAQGNSGGFSHQPNNYYGQQSAMGVSTNAPRQNYGASNHAYGGGYGTSHQQQAAPVLRGSKYKDPCVPAPSCLASFGFGGNVVTMFPKRKLRLNIAGSSFRNSPRAPVPSHLDNSAHGELRKGPVSVYRMEQLHPKNRHFEQMEKFPGPLTENVSEQTILQYLDEQLKDVSSSTSEQEDERLLLGILNILVKCNGKLRSDSSGNPSDPDSPEVQLVTLLRESDQHRRGNRPAVFPPPKPVQTGMHPDLLAKNGNTIRELLLVGDRKAAVDTAIHAQMWPEAMLIASFTDKDEYKRVLRTYLEGHYSIGDPCRALYMSFADQQEKSVHEPQKLMQAPQHESSSSILPSWVTHAQVLLANRTGDTNKILVELGDRLWQETGSILAAHVCYLAAGISVEAPSPNSKIALLGADHRTPKEARFYVSSSAVQRTEIYEWIQKRTNANSTNMIPFQGYKLIYAMILADHGKLETSFKYVSSMLSVIKAVTATMKPGTSMYLEGMQNQLTVLDDRLRQHLGQHRVNSVASSTSKQGKWGLGSALSIMGKIVTRVVEGSDGSTTAASAQTGPQEGSSLFPGAPRSNNPNSTPVYQSSSAPSYPAYGQQGSTDPKPTPSYPNTPSQSYPGYGQQQGMQGGPRSNEPQATPVQSYPGYGQQGAPANSFGAPHQNMNPAYPSTPSQSYPGYGQPNAQGGAPSTPASSMPLYPSTPSQSYPTHGPPGTPSQSYSNLGHPGTPSQSYPGFGQPGAPGLHNGPRSNDHSAPVFARQHSTSYPGYNQHGMQSAPQSNDSTASRGYPRVPSQSNLGFGHHGAPHAGDLNANAAYPGTPSQSYPGYGQQQGLQGAPRSNDSKAIPPYQAGPSQAYPGYGQQGLQGVPDGGAFGAHGNSQHGPSSTSSYGAQEPNTAAPPSAAYAISGNNQPTQFPSGPPSQDRFTPPARSNTAPPPSSGSDNDYGLPPTPQRGPTLAPAHPPYMAGGFGNQPHFSNSAPSSMPASPSTFQKPTLDLSGDAGKGVAVPARRASEIPKSPKNAPADSGASSAPASGPSSDKGSASPKFKDTKKGGRSKTPPPSGSKASSGWFSGISNFIATKVNPEAKVAKLGVQMEAYFDKEKNRWVFPGETATEEAAIPSAPPIGPMPGSTPSSSSGGHPGAGPPGTHSAPGSISGSGSDPLAALMAPPPARAHATLMKKDPLSAMMAPPPRQGAMGARASSMGNVRKPPRPQFAVFKPNPQANPAPASEPTE